MPRPASITSLPTPVQTQAPSSYSGGGGSSYGGSSYGGGGSYFSADVAPAPVVTAPSEEDYLAGDASYNTTISALKSALERYIANQGVEKTSYDKDYQTGLRDLGYDESNQTWNWLDQLTASGRGYQSQLNDFAARGMLQSQGYADANSNLQRSLTDQYNGMAQARDTFRQGQANDLANYQGENTSSQQTARAEAIARRAAQYGLNG